MCFGVFNFFVLCDQYSFVIFDLVEIKKVGAQSLSADDEIAEELRRANDLLEDVSLKKFHLKYNKCCFYFIVFLEQYRSIKSYRLLEQSKI